MFIELVFSTENKCKNRNYKYYLTRNIMQVTCLLHYVMLMYNAGCR